jgi:hypothetical protein
VIHSSERHVREKIIFFIKDKRGGTQSRARSSLVGIHIANSSSLRFKALILADHFISRHLETFQDITLAYFIDILHGIWVE